MKKNILTLILGCYCIGLLLVSCGNDDEADGEKYGEQVRICAVCPEKIVDEEYKLRCIIEVWTKKENAELVYHKEIAVETEKDKFSFDFSLPAGTYQCMMWADYIDAGAVADTDGSSLVRYADKYYDTSNLSCVTVKDLSSFINNEACNAFFYAGEIQKDEKVLQIDLELMHALTKISVQENNLNEFSYLKEVSASYDSFYKFNVGTGTVIEEKQNVIYDEPNFDPLVMTDGTLFTVCLFSDDKERRLGEIDMKLTKWISSSSTEEQQVTVPDIIPLLRGQHVKVSGSMLEITDRENEFDIIFDINVENWKNSNVDITKIKEK